MLNNSGHVNSVSPSGTGTGGRSQAREGKAPPYPSPGWRFQDQGGASETLSLYLSQVWGATGQPRLGLGREGC